MKTRPPVNGDFVNEGTFLAMPPAFPGVSLPPEAAASRLHTLCLSSCKNHVFALTRGPEPHILQFAPKGTYGYAVDLGTIAGAGELTAMCSRKSDYTDQLLVAAHPESGTHVVSLSAAHLGAGIQEWHVSQRDIRHTLALPEIDVLDLLLTNDGTTAIARAVDACIFLDWQNDGIRVLAKIPYSVETRVQFLGADGSARVLGIDGRIYQITPAGCVREMELELIQSAVSLTRTAQGLLGVNADGEVMAWDTTTGHLTRHGMIPLLPVLSMVMVPDGRIFASAGDAIAHWFVLENGEPWARDLGVPVSTLSVRRYGFQFPHLLCGDDGQVYAAEDDHGGHLWIYFPASEHRRSGALVS